MRSVSAAEPPTTGVNSTLFLESVAHSNGVLGHRRVKMLLREEDSGVFKGWLLPELETMYEAIHAALAGAILTWTALTRMPKCLLTM